MPAESPQTALPADHPLMKAWEAYKATPEYANTKKWASTARVTDHGDGSMTLTYPHTDGSLWAAFCAGRESASSASTPACSKCGKTPPFPGGTRCQDLQCPLVNWASASHERQIDIAYINGLRAGWNLGVAGDRKTFDSALECREAELRASASATRRPE